MIRNDNEHLWTRKELANYLQLYERMIDYYLAEGTLKRIRCGKRAIRIPQCEVENYLSFRNAI